MEAQQTQLVQQGIKKEGFHITVTQMCITAVFMALTCVATMVVQIPIPLGYAHLGDSVILICAFFSDQLLVHSQEELVLRWQIY